MTGSRGSKLLAAVAAFAAFGGVAAPRRSRRRAAFPPVAESEAEPGISITGIGFARSRTGGASSADPTAVARAVRNARSRAGSIARRSGLRVGEVEGVELRRADPVRERKPARRSPPRRRPSGSRSSAARPTPTARARSRPMASASAPVGRRDPDRSRPIKRAVLAARRRVTPEAAAAARATQPPPPGPPGWRWAGSSRSPKRPPPTTDTGHRSTTRRWDQFGPGQFCGFLAGPRFSARTRGPASRGREARPQPQLRARGDLQPPPRDRLPGAALR